MAQNQPPSELIFKPALRQIGTTKCPICETRVAVFLAKTLRPFINCSYCSVRVFYNGQESIRLLKKKMEPVKDEPIRIPQVTSKRR